MLTSGSTAIDGGARMSEAGGTASRVARRSFPARGARAAGRSTRYQPTPGAPSAMPSAIRRNSMPARGRGPVVSMRPALTSNAQASTSVIGKPSPSAITARGQDPLGQAEAVHDRLDDLQDGEGDDAVADQRAEHAPLLHLLEPAGSHCSILHGCGSAADDARDGREAKPRRERTRGSSLATHP